MLAQTSHAQVARALIRTGDLLSGQPITAVSETAANRVGGYAVGVSTGTGTSTVQYIWGSATGGPGSVLFTEGTYGGYVVGGIEAFFGISNAGVLAHSPTVSGAAPAGSDSVWLDTAPVMVEGQPHPSLAGQFWSFGSRPGITADGRPYWVGGITAVSGGATQNRGLFFGAAATPLLLGGQVVPDLPAPLGTGSTVSFDYRVAPGGVEYLAEVQLAGFGTTVDNAMVKTGRGVVLDGVLVREGNPAPPSAGGMPGEAWQNFDYCGITDGGQWLLTGDTSAATDRDEFLMVTGRILHREGAPLPSGEVLSGAIGGAAMNNHGDWAATWAIAGGVPVLLLNGRIVLRGGDAVDWDGDGSADPNATVSDFTGVTGLSMSDRLGAGEDVRLYFPAETNVGGGVMEAAYVLTVPCAGLRRCDSNCDGLVNFDDIDGFVLALTGAAAYELQYPRCSFRCNNDVNVDGLVDFGDIDAFVACLAGAP